MDLEFVGDAAVTDSGMRLFDATTGDAGVEDAAVDFDATSLCPFDAGCPCNGSSCGASTIANIPSDFNDFALSGTELYISTNEGLLDVPLEGAGAVDAGYLYTTDGGEMVGATSLGPDGLYMSIFGSAEARIARLDLISGAVTSIVAMPNQSGNASDQGLAVNGSRVYWNDYDGVVHATFLDGGGALSANAGGGGKIRLDSSNLYTGGQDSVLRMTLGISRVEAEVGPWDGAGIIALDEDASVLWSGFAGQSLYRAPLGFASDSGVLISSAPVAAPAAFGSDDAYFYFTNADDGMVRCLKPVCAGGQTQVTSDDVQQVIAERDGIVYYLVTDPASGNLVLNKLPIR